jgi:hypothetical protein
MQFPEGEVQTRAWVVGGVQGVPEFDPALFFPVFCLLFVVKSLIHCHSVYNC